MREVDNEINIWLKKSDVTNGLVSERLVTDGLETDRNVLGLLV
jgi:hypothetical protein